MHEQAPRCSVNCHVLLFGQHKSLRTLKNSFTSLAGLYQYKYSRYGIQLYSFIQTARLSESVRSTLAGALHKVYITDCTSSVPHSAHFQSAAVPKCSFSVSSLAPPSSTLSQVSHITMHPESTWSPPPPAGSTAPLYYFCHRWILHRPCHSISIDHLRSVVAIAEYPLARLNCNQRLVEATSGRLGGVRTAFSAGGAWESELRWPRRPFSTRSSARRSSRASSASGAVACASPAFLDDSMAQDKCALRRLPLSRR